MASTWTNWVGDQRCAPAERARPGSEAELAELVAGAAARGLAVRAVGAGHSFTDCACTDGLLLDTSGLQQVLYADPATGLVTVQAGIRLHRLGEELAARDLGLENQGDIDAQALAGALATATHGTGLRFPNLSARVVGMRLVTATGEVADLRAETDAEALLAARVGVGALGVVSAVTLRAVPLYTLHRRDEPRPLADVLARLDALAEGHDHFEFFVFPYTRTALVRETHRSDEPPAPPPAWRRRLSEDVLENGALGLVCRSGRAVPRAVPRLNALMAGALPGGETVDRAHRVYATRRAVRFNEMEYAIPRAAAREAVERVLDVIERRRLPILFPLEVRFSAGDDAFLSTAHGRETAYVAVHQYRGMEFETLFRAVEAIMDELDGRPHWGKRHYQVAATLRDRYPAWDRWQAVRARLDPGGTFTNDYVRRTLGPVAA
jgi:L-gulonolactone oxidase